jgi:hypothetical protein
VSAVDWELVLVVAYDISTYDMTCLGRVPSLCHKTVQMDSSTQRQIDRDKLPEASGHQAT